MLSKAQKEALRIISSEELLGIVGGAEWIPESKREVYEIVACILGNIYRVADWRKIAQNKIATDIFEHRIKASSRKPTVSEFVSKLCNYLSIQALYSVEPDLIMYAEKYRNDFLEIVRKESQLSVMLAKRYAEVYREKYKQKQAKKGEKAPKSA